MKNIFVTFTLLASIFALSVAMASETSPYQFLRYNSGARAAALGGATVSIAGDGSMLFYNPAVLPTVKQKPVTATFLKHVMDINSGSASYVRHYDGIGSFSASAIFTNYGSFDAADVSGNKTGTFSANDVCLSVGYGNTLDTNLYYGAAMKLIYVGLDDASSAAMAFDFGMLYTLPNGSTSLGLSVLNAGFQLSKFYDNVEKLPLDVRLGISHRLMGLPLLFNFSFHHLADKEDSFGDRFANFSLGGEIYLGEKFMVRLGYDNHIRKNSSPADEKKLSGMSIGAGLKLEKFNIDYSLSQIGLSATLHRIGVSLDI